MTTDERLLINTLRALSLCHTYALCTDKACNLDGDSCAEHRAALVDRVGPRLAQTVLETCADIVTIKAVGLRSGTTDASRKQNKSAPPLRSPPLRSASPTTARPKRTRRCDSGGRKYP